jgi:hypothetical protein
MMEGPIYSSRGWNRPSMAKSMKMMNSVIWDVMLCDLVEVYLCLGGMYRLHLQGQRVSQASSKSQYCLLIDPDDGRYTFL